MQNRSGVLMLTAALALAQGCDMSEQQEAPAAPSASVDVKRTEADAREDASFDGLFREAGQEFNVPPALLKSISFVQTRYQMVQGAVEFEGRPSVHGLMALSGAVLEEGARLAGVSVEQARTDARSNVRAAAAFLSRRADALQIDRTRAEQWAPAVAEVSGIESEEGRRSFVHNDVFRVARQGLGTLSQEWTPPAEEGLVQQQAQALAVAPDYPAGVWRPSPNYSTRPIGIRMVIIHTCESGYTSCWSWLTNNSSDVSAHYVVREDGGEVSQLVRDASKAWHISAAYDCSRNGGVACELNGRGSNDFTLGIEHGGYASTTNWPVTQIDASAKLLCDMTRDHGIPRDRYHVVGHGQLQPYNRTDPGVNWPWSDYLTRATSHCTCSVGGAILTRYNQLGNSTGFLGTCLTNELTTPDGIGRYNHFQHGSIYWTSSTGAWEVYGQIREKWKAMGWEAGVLGYPTTGELGTPDGIGRYNHFRKGSIEGSIYWTPSTGARAVYGHIRAKWASLGWETSSLGYPVSDEYAVTGGRESEFQKGYITYNSSTGALTVRMK